MSHFSFKLFIKFEHDLYLNMMLSDLVCLGIKVLVLFVIV